MMNPVQAKWPVQKQFSCAAGKSRRARRNRLVVAQNRAYLEELEGNVVEEAELLTMRPAAPRLGVIQRLLSLVRRVFS